MKKETQNQIIIIFLCAAFVMVAAATIAGWVKPGKTADPDLAGEPYTDCWEPLDESGLPESGSSRKTAEPGEMSYFVGETASFDKYDLTLESAEARDGMVYAAFIIHPHEEGTFKAKYITAVTEDGDEVKAVGDTGPTELTGGMEQTIMLTFPDFGICGLKLDNWSREAEWDFPADPENNRNTFPDRFPALP